MTSTSSMAAVTTSRMATKLPSRAPVDAGVLAAALVLGLALVWDQEKALVSDQERAQVSDRGRAQVSDQEKAGVMAAVIGRRGN